MPLRITSIVGARPQFIKAAALSREIRKSHTEFLIHTGQHYDYQMSGVFFDGLEIPPPDVNLGIGSGLHGAQTGAMLEAIERVLVKEQPDYLIVYGDTNSTVAGALAAAKLRIPLVHVEAGLRSFNRAMPEEINRVVADHVSDILFCPSMVAVGNLANEGILKNVHVVGDVMLDVLNWAQRRLEATPSSILNSLGLSQAGYVLATLHRSENTDNLPRLSGILSALNNLNEVVVFPVHPRTKKAIASAGLTVAANVRLIDPVSYLDMVALMKGARLITTDSGGLQKEAYWLQRPCITMRNETEWVETVDQGWNLLVGADQGLIESAVKSGTPKSPWRPLYGDGAASQKCVELLG